MKTMDQACAEYAAYSAAFAAVEIQAVLLSIPLHITKHHRYHSNGAIRLLRAEKLRLLREARAANPRYARKIYYFHLRQACPSLA